MGAAVRRPFLLSAPRVRLVGDELDGVERIESGGTPLLFRPRLAGAGPASNVVLDPRRSRRELLVDGRTVVETIVLPERTPGAVIQWLPGPGPEPEREPGGEREREPGRSHALEIGLELPTGTHEVPYDGGGCVRTTGPDGSVVLVRLHPEPERWTLEGRTARARVGGDADVPVTLVVAAGDDADAAHAALSATTQAGVHERRAEAALIRGREERPALHTGVAGLDDALEWARARLDAHAGPVGRAGDAGRVGDATDPLREPLLALGLAAAGDHDGALAVALALPRSEPGALIALAWVTSWVGAPGGWTPAEVAEAAREHLPVVTGRPDTSGAGPSPLDRVLARAAVAAASDVLGALGDRAGSDALADELPETPVALGRVGAPAADGGLRLPVVGGGGRGHDGPAARADEATALVAAVLGVPTDPAWRDGATGPGHPVARGLRSWALFRADRPEEGYLLLREHLAAGDAEEGARGCWSAGADPDRRTPDDGAATALVPIALIHGLLGAEPDAPFGRLRLAPALPASWTAFRITGVRLGRAVLELSCRVDGGLRTFVLRPTAGPVPPNLVFEPTVPDDVARVEVDGEPTDVVPERAGERTRASLQIPLDRERKVTLVGPDA